MLRITEVAGFIGVAIAGAAYVPQVWHLVVERCSAGISRVAFGAWLAASALVTTHAVVSGATVFVVLGIIQLVATALILLLATKFENAYCAGHEPSGGSAAADPFAPPAARVSARARVVRGSTH